MATGIPERLGLPDEPVAAVHGQAGPDDEQRSGASHNLGRPPDARLRDALAEKTPTSGFSGPPQTEQTGTTNPASSTSASPSGARRAG